MGWAPHLFLLLQRVDLLSSSYTRRSGTVVLWGGSIGSLLSAVCTWQLLLRESGGGPRDGDALACLEQGACGDARVRPSSWGFLQRGRPCTMWTLSACCWGSAFHTRHSPRGAPSAQVGWAFFQGSPTATWVGWPRLALPRRPLCFPRANVCCTGARMTLPPQPCRRKGLGHGLSG